MSRWLYFGGYCSSVTQSCPSSQRNGLQHARLPCPSPSPRPYSNSCPLSWWGHPTVSSSVIPLSSHLQSFPASGSFLRSQLFTSGGQSIGASASASVLPMNIQGWSPLGWTGWMSLQSKGLSRVFFNTAVQKHQYFGAHPTLWPNSDMHPWLLEKTIKLNHGWSICIMGIVKCYKPVQIRAFLFCFVFRQLIYQHNIDNLLNVDKAFFQVPVIEHLAFLQ